MLFITERSTKQRNLTDGSVLSMVSLFVVAYPHEVAKFEEDEFKSFLEEARKQGRMKLDVPEGMTETVEVSQTRKGFLIKASVIDFVADAETKPTTLDQVFAEHEADLDAEKYRPVKGYANYEFSNKGNLRNVKTGNLVKRDGNRFKVSQDGQSASLSLGDLEAQY
jgi:hypothetical protein